MDTLLRSETGEIRMRKMEQIREIGFDWTTRDERAYFSTNVKSEIRKMTKYATTVPDEVTVIKDPETNGGYLVASVPKSWFRIKPPCKRMLSEEQRLIMRKRMEETRKNKGEGKSSSYVPSA